MVPAFQALDSIEPEDVASGASATRPPVSTDTQSEQLPELDSGSIAIGDENGEPVVVFHWLDDDSFDVDGQVRTNLDSGQVIELIQWLQAGLATRPGQSILCAPDASLLNKTTEQAPVARGGRVVLFSWGDIHFAAHERIGLGWLVTGDGTVYECADDAIRNYLRWVLPLELATFAVSEQVPDDMLAQIMDRATIREVSNG